MKTKISQNKARAQTIFSRLASHYPGVSTFLDHDTPFQLLIATILSAQCTDARVNLVTPALFEAYPDAKTMAQASVDEIREKIKSINFCNNKAINLLKTATLLQDQYQGEVPPDLSVLVTLPGVGRKTANVVLGQAFGLPGITVDTHVNRLSRRLGFTTHTEAVPIEKDLMQLWPKTIWSDFSTVLIVHGRQVCFARKPQCEGCFLSDLCPRVGVNA
ncbi:MAG: endonuclease III [Candidatus Margulisiibacteriota bacterium]